MSIRDLEQRSIRDYLEAVAEADIFRGKVLDFGAGRQPYEDIVSREGEYHPFDRASFPAHVGGQDLGPDLGVFQPDTWDAILCTQVVQYLPAFAYSAPWGTRYRLDPLLDLLDRFLSMLKPGGWLVMTGPTNWPVVEEEDLRRYTPSGVRVALVEAGFSPVFVEARAVVRFENEDWVLGWGARGRKG